MAEAYSLLVNKCDQVANQNRSLSQTVEKLKSDGMTLTLEELLNFAVAQNQPYLMSLKYLILFIKYRAEAPRNNYHEEMLDHFKNALSIIPGDVRAEVRTCIIESYFSALTKEIETYNHEKLKLMIGVYGKIKADNINVEALEDSLYLRLTDMVANNIEDDNIDINKATEVVKVIVYAQNNGLDVSEIASLIIGNLKSNLNLNFEIYKGGQRNDLRDHSLLIGQLKLLKINIESDASQVKFLDDFFGSLVEQVNQSSPKKQLLKNPNLPSHKINFGKMVEKETIFDKTKEKYTVSVKHYTCPQYGEVALKTYELKDPTYDTTNIEKEIEILEKLSKESKPDSCFLKLFAAERQDNKFYLLMEYHNDTLIDVIKRMKSNQQKFTDEEIKKHVSDLLSAFSEMCQKKIYHQDIKPQNLLMTSNGKLKIIDFSISESKSYNDTTSTTIGLFKVQGTQGYMAPELEAHFLSGNSSQEKLEYDREKADVFSLGYTLLQMYFIETEELYTSNHPENNGKLMAKVDEVKTIWLSTLLRGMLKFDYKQRYTFKQCLYVIEGVGDTLTNN